MTTKKTKPEPESQPEAKKPASEKKPAAEAKDEPKKPRARAKAPEPEGYVEKYKPGQRPPEGVAERPGESKEASTAREDNARSVAQSERDAFERAVKAVGNARKEQASEERAEAEAKKKRAKRAEERAAAAERDDAGDEPEEGEEETERRAKTDDDEGEESRDREADDDAAGDDDDAGETPAAAAAKKPQTEAAKREAAKAEANRRRFAGLQREEQRLREERENLKTEKTKTELELATLRKEADALKRIQSGDVLGGLEAMGLTYSQLTAAMMKRGSKADPEAIAKLIDERVGNEVQSIKKQLDEEKAKREKAELARGVAEYRAELRKELAPGKDDRWELLHLEADDPAAEVHELIRIEWEREGKPVDEQGVPIALSTAEAADKIEKYLLEKSKKLLRAKKLRSDAEPESEEQSSPSERRAGKDGKAPAKKPPVTLGNNHVSEVSRNGRNTADPTVLRKNATAVLRNLRAANS